MKIELRNIHKIFGPVHANNNITTTFEEGQIIGVLGENGAGKSTLMKIIAGYQPADRGEILIDGYAVAYAGPQAALAKGIGMLQQDPLDVGAFTVLENFAYGQQANGFVVNQRAIRNKLEELVSRFGFELDANTPIEQLSIAQRQQLEIVRLMALGVRTLILDEPTTGISLEQKTMLFDALRVLAKAGMTVLLVSHKLEDVMSLCDAVIVLRAGRLVGEKTLPATKAELVTLMFGEDLPMPERVRGNPGEGVLALENAHLKAERLDMPNVNVRLHAGEVIGFAGLDGSGQKPVMRALAGLTHLFAGQVRLNGQDYSGSPYYRFMNNGVIYGASGRVEEGLIAGLTLTEHSALVMDRRPLVNWRRAGTLMAQQITDYDIRGRPTDTIEQLSGGNQQRVLISLLPESPTALILEQPTRGLDVHSARWIWQQLLARRERGAGIIFSSEDLEELVTYSDRIIVFFAGLMYEVLDVNQTSIDELGHLISGEFADKSAPDKSAPNKSALDKRVEKHP